MIDTNVLSDYHIWCTKHIQQTAKWTVQIHDRCDRFECKPAISATDTLTLDKGNRHKIIYLIFHDFLTALSKFIQTIDAVHGVNVNVCLCVCVLISDRIPLLSNLNLYYVSFLFFLSHKWFWLENSNILMDTLVFGFWKFQIFILHQNLHAT